MSYLAPSGLIGKTLELIEFDVSGTPAANGYFTFDSEIESTFSDSVSGAASNTLTLPNGYYWAQCVFSVTRTSANQNYEFIFEVDGTETGKAGQSGWLNNIRSDFADAMFKDLTGTTSLKLKCLSIENSAPTLSSDSRVYIWRVKP